MNLATVATKGSTASLYPSPVSCEVLPASTGTSVMDHRIVSTGWCSSPSTTSSVPSHVGLDAAF